MSAHVNPNLPRQVRFLGDPTAKFTSALGLAFDGSAIFGGDRSKRYALVVEDGKVKEAYVEPDNTGVNSKSPLLQLLFLCDKYLNLILSCIVSAAERVLGEL